VDRGARSFQLFGAIGVLLLLIAVLAYQSWWRFNPDLDLHVYLEASRAFWNGANPYAIGTRAPFVYPLFVCVILWPLAQLPFEVATVVWFVLSLIGLAAALGMILRMAGPVDVARAVMACAIVCVLLTEVLQNNLRNAQINFLVLACTVAFASYWSRGRRGVASWWLAVAIAIKITPGIFLIWLARRRDWRTFAVTTATVLGLTIALPAVVAGPRIVDDMRGYAQTFIGGVTPGLGTTSERRPFSVVGTLHRFTDVSWRFDAVVLGLGVLLVTGLLFDRGARVPGQETAALVSLYLTAALLVTPLSEVHHLAFILPGIVWLVHRALTGELSRTRLAVLAFVIAALMLRRSFHAAAIVGVSSTWILLAAECYSIHRARRVDPGNTPGSLPSR
jgi:alpha-1,2-mannosyltransferase